MRAVEQKPAVAGFFGTVVVWILIFLFFYLSAALFAPKQYKTIKIRLDSPQKTESGKLKTENAPVEKVSEAAQAQASQSEVAQAEVAPPAPAKQEPVSSQPKSAASESVQLSVAKTQPAKTESAKSMPKKSEPKKTETPKQSQQKPSQSAQNPQKAATKPVEQPKPSEQVLQKSMDELLAEQQKKPAPKKEFDWSQFDDIEGNTSSPSAQMAKAAPTPANTNALSGSAASSANAGTNTAATAASSNGRNAASQSTSAATSSALASAVSAKAYSASAGGVSSTVTANTGSSSDGKVSLQMADGSPRVLLEPSEPKIILSDEASALIDSTKRLSVSFTVTASGNVPVTSVRISPDILPSLVTMEIREQISRWRFQSAPSDGAARFEYTIQKN